MLGADVVGQGGELIPVGMMEHESFFLDTLGIPVPVEKVHCQKADGRFGFIGQQGISRSGCPERLRFPRACLGLQSGRLPRRRPGRGLSRSRYWQ